MKRPAFQFYPGDWLRDTALRACSVPARGLWADMLCLMHEGRPYGHLKVGAKDILPPILARMVGASLDETEGWLAELEQAGVFSRTEVGTIFSRRMVRDEEIRQARAAGGVKSLQHPHVPQPKGPGKGRSEGYPSTPSSEGSFGGSPASASASASARETTTPPTPPRGADAPPGVALEPTSQVSGNGVGTRLTLHRKAGKPPSPSRSLPAVLTGLQAFLAEVGQQTEREVEREKIRDVMVDLAFAYWAKRTRHDTAKLDRKRYLTIRKRLTEGDDNVHQVLFAVDGALKDDNLMGRKADSTRKYDGVSTIYRDWEQVERLAALGGYHEGAKHAMAVKYLDGATVVAEGAG